MWSYATTYFQHFMCDEHQGVERLGRSDNLEVRRAQTPTAFGGIRNRTNIWKQKG